jgi:hypothetical protein
MNRIHNPDRSFSASEQSGLTSSSQDLNKVTYWGLARRVGYLLPFAHVLGFWPRFGIEYHSASVSSVPSTPGSGIHQTAIDFEANLVVMPAAHFGLLINPYAAIPLGSGSHGTAVFSVI